MSESKSVTKSLKEEHFYISMPLHPFSSNRLSLVTCLEWPCFVYLGYRVLRPADFRHTTA